MRIDRVMSKSERPQHGLAIDDSTNAPERAMSDEAQNLRTVELKVREQLNGVEKSWVIGRLVARNGVNGAVWRSEEPRVSIEYDADLVSGAELFDLLELCGLHARPARLAPARPAV